MVKLCLQCACVWLGSRSIWQVCACCKVWWLTWWWATSSSWWRAMGGVDPLHCSTAQYPGGRHKWRAWSSSTGHLLTREVIHGDGQSFRPRMVSVSDWVTFQLQLVCQSLRPALSMRTGMWYHRGRGLKKSLSFQTIRDFREVLFTIEVSACLTTNHEVAGSIPGTSTIVKWD